MRELFVGIYSRLAGSALEVSCAGGLFLHRAPQEMAMPFGVYQKVSGTPEYTFDTVHENVLVQFNLFSGSSTDVEISGMYDDLTALYDDCKLEVSGYRSVKMIRELDLLTTEGEDVWKYTVQYRALIEKE